MYNGNMISLNVFGNEFNGFGFFSDLKEFGVDELYEMIRDNVNLSVRFKLTSEEASLLKKRVLEFHKFYWSMYDEAELSEQIVDRIFYQNFLRGIRDVNSGQHIRTGITGEEINAERDNDLRDAFMDLGLTEEEANGLVYRRYYNGCQNVLLGHGAKFVIPDLITGKNINKARVELWFPPKYSLEDLLQMDDETLIKRLNGKKALAKFKVFIEIRKKFTDSHICKEVTKERRRELVNNVLSESMAYFGGKTYSAKFINYLLRLGLSNGEIKKIMYS